MGEWLDTAQQLVVLLTGLAGLISAGIGAFFAIRNWIKATKEKSAKEIWAMIMSIADAAMKEVEKSSADGATKKELVVNAVKEGCKAAGLDLDPFIDQLGAYIDSCIGWYNGMTDSAKAAKKAKK